MADTGRLNIATPGLGPNLADDGLVERIRARDIRAFESFYRSHHARLTRFLQNLLRRPHLLEEVLNDTMVVVWNRVDGFDGKSRLSTWMFGIAYRQAMNALRRLDEPVDDERTEPTDEGDVRPDRTIATELTRKALEGAMMNLSPAHRAVVNLTYFQEFSYREIAEIPECPVGTAKTRMFHARRQLRRTLLASRPTGYRMSGMNDMAAAPRNVHEDAQRLLPWFVTDRLGMAEKALVEAHLAGCEQCRREFAEEHALAAALRGDQDGMPDAWPALQARLLNERSAPLAPGSRSAPRGAWARTRRLLREPRALRWIATAQFAVILFLSASLLPGQRATEYRALSDAPATPAGNVLVRFHSDAREAELRNALERAGAHVVGGPTEAGAYVLDLPDARQLQAFRREKVVIMAEPIGRVAAE